MTQSPITSHFWGDSIGDLVMNASALHLNCHGAYFRLGILLWYQLCGATVVTVVRPCSVWYVGLKPCGFEPAALILSKPSLLVYRPKNLIL